MFDKIKGERLRFLRYIFCALLFVTAAVADTININWINGDETYAQTTCKIGGDIILPSPPTRRGYSFGGWITAKYNQLVDITKKPTQTIYGVTFTQNGDGTVSLSGTATEDFWADYILFIGAEIITGHVYYISGCPKGGGSKTYYWHTQSCGWGDEYGNGVIAQGKCSSEHIAFNICKGVNVDGLILSAQMFDLTEMFGAGNEPTTVELAKEMIAIVYGQKLDYYPYKTN